MRYYHLGIPTKQKRYGETHLAHLKIYVSGYEQNPYGVEWVRFEDDAEENPVWGAEHGLHIFRKERTDE
ncbi:MAG: hypothetical protein WBG01_05495 [Bacteroidota bacterium]